MNVSHNKCGSNFINSNKKSRDHSDYSDSYNFNFGSDILKSNMEYNFRIRKKPCNTVMSCFQWSLNSDVTSVALVSPVKTIAEYAKINKRTSLTEELDGVALVIGIISVLIRLTDKAFETGIEKRTIDMHRQAMLQVKDSITKLKRETNLPILNILKSLVILLTPSWENDTIGRMHKLLKDCDSVSNLLSIGAFVEEPTVDPINSCWLSPLIRTKLKRCDTQNSYLQTFPKTCTRKGIEFKSSYFNGKGRITGDHWKNLLNEILEAMIPDNKPVPFNKNNSLTAAYTLASVISHFPKPAEKLIDVCSILFTIPKDPRSSVWRKLTRKKYEKILQAAFECQNQLIDECASPTQKNLENKTGDHSRNSLNYDNKELRKQKLFKTYKFSNIPRYTTKQCLNNWRLGINLLKMLISPDASSLLRDVAIQIAVFFIPCIFFELLIRVGPQNLGFRLDIFNYFRTDIFYLSKEPVYFEPLPSFYSEFCINSVGMEKKQDSYLNVIGEDGLDLINLVDPDCNNGGQMGEILQNNISKREDNLESASANSVLAKLSEGKRKSLDTLTSLIPLICLISSNDVGFTDFVDNLREITGNKYSDFNPMALILTSLFSIDPELMLTTLLCFQSIANTDVEYSNHSTYSKVKSVVPSSIALVPSSVSSVAKNNWYSGLFSLIDSCVKNGEEGNANILLLSFFYVTRSESLPADEVVNYVNFNNKKKYIFGDVLNFDKTDLASPIRKVSSSFINSEENLLLKLENTIAVDNIMRKRID